MENSIFFLPSFYDLKILSSGFFFFGGNRYERKQNVRPLYRGRRDVCRGVVRRGAGQQGDPECRGLSELRAEGRGDRHRGAAVRAADERADLGAHVADRDGHDQRDRTVRAFDERRFDLRLRRSGGGPL